MYLPTRSIMDAKEWSKIAENMVKTRWYLYQLIIDEEIDSNIKDKIMVIRQLLLYALEELDKVAAWDAKGWL